MFRLRTLLVAAPLLPCAALGAHADTIHLVDGSSIEGVKIRTESLTAVDYGSKEVAAGDVVSVVYTDLPETLSNAQLSADEGDYDLALLLLDNYLETTAEDGPRRGFGWAPAWAAFRKVEIYATKSDLTSMGRAAEKVISGFPESRYVPLAYLAKAEAETRTDRGAQAVKSLEALIELAETAGLSDRFRHAAEIERAAVNPAVEPLERVDTLDRLARAAGTDFPTARDRAFLAMGQLYIQVAEATEGDVSELIDNAETQFSLVVEGDASLGATRAGAYCGLGEVAFARATRMNDSSSLVTARDHFLRATVLYPEVSRYAAKSMFYAGLCFRQLGDLNQDSGSKQRSRMMMRQVIAEHPATSWAEEARRYK
ncbi:MAG: hypothetical protein AAFZ65_12635 [Planctomycetota bacterium]